MPDFIIPHLKIKIGNIKTQISFSFSLPPSLPLSPSSSPLSHTLEFEYILQFCIFPDWGSRAVFGGEDVGVASLEGKIILTFKIYIPSITTSRKPPSLSESDSAFSVPAVLCLPLSLSYYNVLSFIFVS